MKEVLDVIVSGLIVACAAASLVFVLGYGVAAPWYRSEAGRQIFFSGLTFLGICTLGTATVVFGADWEGRTYVRLLVWSSVFVFLMWRNRLLFEAQLRKESHDGSEERRSDSTTRK